DPGALAQSPGAVADLRHGRAGAAEFAVEHVLSPVRTVPVIFDDGTGGAAVLGTLVTSRV
ncbi:hypothetical protein, partial [Streptomyces acidiscabies]|uniref:hypothetical protein n=1 Tax=Streptomyces acidiscabies TaxID=42234 RepID=UPI001C4C5036